MSSFDVRLIVEDDWNPATMDTTVIVGEWESAANWSVPDHPNVPRAFRDELVLVETGVDTDYWDFQYLDTDGTPLYKFRQNVFDCQGGFTT